MRGGSPKDETKPNKERVDISETSVNQENYTKGNQA